MTDAEYVELAKKLAVTYGEDAAQEGLIALHVQHPELEGVDAEKFARRCAKNKMIDMVRRERVMSRIDLADAPRSFVRLPAKQHDRAEARQVLERLDVRLVDEALGYSMTTPNSSYGRVKRYRLRRKGLQHVTT